MDAVGARHPRGWSRLVSRAILSSVLVGAALLATPGTASAHAQLEVSDPTPGTVLPVSPTVVTLTFGTRVNPSDSAIELFDDRFQRVDVGRVTPVGPERNGLQVRVRPQLHRGTYTVSWHATSADTHPVSGVFRFSVGAPSVVHGTAPGSGRNDTAGRMLALLRWAGYVGLVLGPGILLVALWLWPEGLADRRTRRLAGAGLCVLAVSTFGGMLLQGVWASGRPLSALWTDPGSLSTHSRQFDEVYAARSYVLVGFGAALVAALSTATRAPGRSRRLLLAAAAVSTVALAATWPLVGHSAAGSATALALPLNFLHTLAMTVWLGGLVLLLVGLRRSLSAEELAQVLPRFSRLALACVATLVATGTYLAWREVGSLEALTATTFGKVLLTKLAGVVVLLVLGNLARTWVGRRVPAGGPQQAGVAGSVPVEEGAVSQLRRGMAAEVVVAAGVLALTAALIVLVPAREEFVRPFNQTVAVNGAEVVVRIPSPRVGSSSVDVSVVGADGHRSRISGATGSMSLRGDDGPAQLLHSRAANGQGADAVRLALTFPRSGQWVLRLNLQTSPGTTAVSLLVPVTSQAA